MIVCCGIGAFFKNGLFATKLYLKITQSRQMLTLDWRGSICTVFINFFWINLSQCFLFNIAKGLFVPQASEESLSIWNAEPTGSPLYYKTQSFLSLLINVPWSYKNGEHVPLFNFPRIISKSAESSSKIWKRCLVKFQIVKQKIKMFLKLKCSQRSLQNFSDFSLL